MSRSSKYATALFVVLAAMTAPGHPAVAEAARTAVVVADNAATSTPSGTAGGASKKDDAVAFPNSPNGTPAAGNQGQPIPTDRAACDGSKTGCADSAAPSKAADTDDATRSTPTTVGGAAQRR